MPSKKILMPSIAISLLLPACQSTPIPVIERENHIFETTGLGSTKTVAKSQAIGYANKQCGIRSVIVIEDNLKYNGILDEKTGRALDQTTKVLGAVLGTPTPRVSRYDDYEYHIRFRCR